MSDERDIPSDAKGRLSGKEATTLAGQVAALAKSGLPLEPGLRALADEFGHGRLARVLREMADRLEAGDSLEQVIQS